MAGMEPASDWDELRAADTIVVPAPEDFWFPFVNLFALTYNAYEREGGFEVVAQHAREVREGWNEGSDLPESLTELRSALFFEQRFWRNNQSEPREENRRYIDALLVAIHKLTGGTISGPADDLP
jgi:hypothetical protein